MIKYLNAWLNREKDFSIIPISSYVRVKDIVRVGDVLLIAGKTRMSGIIKTLTKSSWSHSMLYIGNGLIFEGVVGKGFYTDPLDKYADHHIRICRPRNISEEQIRCVVDYCLNNITSTYSLRHIFDLMRYLLPWRILPRKFRSILFYKNGLVNEEICSSIIARAFYSVGFPLFCDVQDEKGAVIKTDNPRIVMPCDFDQSPFFDIVKYPMQNIKIPN